MALRNIHSRLWLIPLLMVLLLWGCGEDVGLVEDDDHARVVIESPTATVTLDTDYEPPTGTEPAELTWTWSNNSVNILLNNFPRLGDDQIDGGGILAEVQNIDIYIYDLAGNLWARLPYTGRHVVEPNGQEPITIYPLLPMALENEILDRYFLDASLYSDADRLELAEFTVVMNFRIREYTADGHYESTYTVGDTITAWLIHTGDRLY